MTHRVQYSSEWRVTIAPGYTDREFIDSLLASVGIPIVVVNLESRLAMWNEAFAAATAILDRPPATIAGLPLARVVPEFAQPIRDRDWLATITKVIDEAKGYRELRVPLTLGLVTPHRYDVAVQPLLRRDGHVLGAVLVLEDVTEQVKLEERLLRIARTTSLADLGASVAHEIRNPLNSIGLNLARLEERLAARPLPEDDDSLDILGMVADEVRRLERIVRDFLRFSRPPRAIRKPLQVRDVIRRCLAILDAEAATQNVELRSHLGELSEVEADPDLLMQVFHNLVLNAIQAAATTATMRPAVVEIDGFETETAIAIVVRDTGPGLPEGEARKKIFDLFYSTKEAGTGLGLAIANRLIEDHGGSITAENTPAGSEGKGGAVFTVYLPKHPPVIAENTNDEARWR